MSSCFKLCYILWSLFLCLFCDVLYEVGHKKFYPKQLCLEVKNALYQATTNKLKLFEIVVGLGASRAG